MSPEDREKLQVQDERTGGSKPKGERRTPSETLGQELDKATAWLESLRSTAVAEEVRPPARVVYEQNIDRGVIEASMTECYHCDHGIAPVDDPDAYYRISKPCLHCAHLRREVKLVNAACLPVVPSNAKLDTWRTDHADETPEMRRSRAVALETARAVVDGTAPGLMLLGAPGTGKTHLMVGIARALLAKRSPSSVHFCAWNSLMSEAHKALKSGGSADKLVEPLIEADVTFIDEVGAASGAMSERLFDHVVQTRHDKGRRLVLATNHTVDALSERIGRHAMSRIGEMCVPVQLVASDRRKPAACDTERLRLVNRGSKP